MLPAQDATREELHELGIFVHDYELYIANQLNYLLAFLKYIPRYVSGKAQVALAS